ncbi:hypothetical protein B0H14DRAFT_2625793 [Mycena olivaceomarginata]|nr:hypothetical protein B0H14DRAFT_2625793 [Mycena olivaceomarginata]
MSQPSGSAAPANPLPASNGGHALLAVNPPPSNPTGNNGGQPLFAPNSPPNPRESPPPEPHTPTRPHSGPSLWNSFLELSNELAPETVLHGPRGSLATWTVLPTQDTADDFSASADVSAPASVPERDVFSARADASVPEREVSAPASAPERDVFSASVNVSVPERDVSPASALECDTLEHNADRPACSGESEDDEDFDELESSVPATPARPLPTPALPPPPAYVADPPSPPPVYNPDPFNLTAITPGSRRNANIPLVAYASNPDSPQSPDRPRSLSPPHSRYLAPHLAMTATVAIFKGDFGTRDEESEEEWRMQEEETAEVREAQKEQRAVRRMWAQQERIDALEQMGFEEQLMQELEREELENQVGGGRRQATPPIITRTYLRPGNPPNPQRWARSGRPTKEQLAAVGACHSEMDRLVEKCAGETGLTHHAILRSYHNAPGTTRSSNPWNIYQKYARAIENARKNGPASIPQSTTSRPSPATPTATLPLSKAKTSKKRGPSSRPHTRTNRRPDQLRDWREMDRLCTEVTVGARRRHFHGAGGKVAQILKTLSKRHNFQSLLIFTGSYANEDQQLAMFQSTGGLAQIFTDLRPNLPVLDQHDILGIAKNIAASNSPCSAGDEDDQEADVSAASRAAVADASASRAQNKNATQALLQSAQNVLNQFQTQGVKFTENDLSRRQLRQVEERDATHALQTRLSGAATTDTGNDFFHVVVARNNNFAWKQLHLIWKRERIYVQNWPQGVRPPVLMKRGKSISALTKPELKLLIPLSMRGMNRAKASASHNYSLPSPSGPPDTPAVRKFWRSSLTEPVLCVDGKGVVWKTQYDLDLPTNGVVRTVVVPNEHGTADESEEPAAPRKGKDKAGKEKKRVVEDEDDYKVEVESEEETRPAPATQKRKADDGESAPNKRRKASSTPSAPPPPAPSVPLSAPSRKKLSAAASSHPKRKARSAALETVGEHSAPSPRLSPAPAPSRRKRKGGALETVDERVEPAQEGGVVQNPWKAWVNISHNRPPATSSGRTVHFERSDSELSSVPEPGPPPPPKRRRGADTSAPVTSREVMSHVAVPLPPAVTTRRTTRSTTAASSAAAAAASSAAASSAATSSVATSSAALERGGTIYAVHNPQPIGEWFSAADNKNSVVGTLHVAPSDVPQRQAAAPRRAKGAKAPTTAASDARPNRKPKEAPSMLSGAPGPSLTLSAGTPNASNMSFGAPGPLLTSSAGPPNAAAPDITAAPAPTPIVTPAIVPAVPTPTPAPPPLDPAALVGLWAQLNQVFGGRDPAQVIAEMQGPPPQ